MSNTETPQSKQVWENYKTGEQVRIISVAGHFALIYSPSAGRERLINVPKDFIGQFFRVL